jgi:hypothetical protein
LSATKGTKGTKTDVELKQPLLDTRSVSAFYFVPFVPFCGYVYH